VSILDINNINGIVTLLHHFVAEYTDMECRVSIMYTMSRAIIVNQMTNRWLLSVLLTLTLIRQENRKSQRKSTQYLLYPRSSLLENFTHRIP